MRAILVASAVFSLLPSARVRVEAQQLSSEAIQKITANFQEARAHSMNKEYAKSNESYEKVLALLPAVKEGSLEPSRAKIHYDICCNYALLGKKPESIKALSVAIAHGYWDHDFLQQDPSLKEMRSEKEFQELARKAKLGLSRMVLGMADVLTGKKVDARDLDNKVVIVDVWGTWCPPCRREIPHFVNLQKKLGSQGLQIVGLTWEKTAPQDADRKRVASFGKEQSVNYPLVMLEPELYNLLAVLYGVRSFPTTYIFDREGGLRHRFVGLQEYSVLESKVSELLAKK